MIGRTRNLPVEMTVYEVSVVDSDGDMLLDRASIQAPTLQSAWEQAIVIAFRVCQGSGALPMTITVVQRMPHQRP